MTTAVETFALSFAQQRLWFADQLAPGSPAYNMYEAYRLRGPLDVDALRQALTDTVTRHESLRTTFRAHRGEPYQVIGPAAPVLDVVAVTDLAAEVDRRVRTPFALDKEPPLRTSLLRPADSEDADDHVLLAVVHHIVSDEQSMAVFWRDLCAAYAARAQGRPVALVPPPVRYVDYAAWQRNWLSGDLLADELDHWRRELAGAPLVLELPSDKTRPARLDARGVVPFRLPADVLAGVHVVGRAAGATAFMTLLAAFTALLAKATGRDDVVVGTFAANRSIVEVEDIVGLFVNTLPLRVRLGEDPAFEDLLATVRLAAMDGIRHEEVPFDQVVTAVGPSRDLSRNPLAQVAFQALAPTGDRVRLPGTAVSPYAVGQCGDPFDVRLAVRGAEGELHYAAELFTPSSAASLAEWFVRIVTAAVARPGLRLTQLPDRP
ncbi:condensation domain-containing protein [Actinophytocola sp.]|uniref:condensation domain-containing protein n=1 Tax=Actinophytocola sp. TaxID=1872138 RepID=UPI00389B1159